MKKRLLCLLLVLLQLPIFALAENVENSLVVGMVSLESRTPEIRPLTPNEAGVMSLYNVVYESLVTIDDNGVPQPYVAQTWSQTGSGNTWTFTLRDDVKFSDGTPLTAADVKASLDYILKLANDSEATDKGFYQSFRYVISSVDAPDDKTLIVKAKEGRDYYGVLYCMTFPIVHATQVDVAGPLGTGPYMITDFKPGNYMYLSANPNWWQMQPQVQEITATFYPNNKALINAYEYGQVDTAFTRSVSASQYKSGINSLSIPYSTRQLEVVLLNHNAFPLDSPKVRQAIRYALNVNLISQNVYMGMTLDADTPVPSDSWLYYDQESTYVYDPDKARALLEEDGWIDMNEDGTLDKVVGEGTKHLFLKLCVYEDPENDVRFETANMVVDMLADVGITAKPTTMDYAQVSEQLKEGAFEIAICAFQMDVVPDYGFMLRKGNTGNYMRYVSSDMTSLIDTLRTNENQTDFAYTSQAIQQQFTYDAPFVCLFYRQGSVLTRKMYTTVRTMREFELLRGIQYFGR
ncbi:MAG: ABC transporter substrate-binding protein [Clostridia bacterium]|nr:ABC transporter substrate-binding protein [Clostridia bacterium]